ncbi:MAG: CHRD domain-containing protein [Acidobacteriota bacterium]
MRSKVAHLLLVAGLIAFFSPGAFAQTTFNFLLRGSEEVPPVFTTAGGFCAATLNAAETELDLRCFQNVENVTAAHIHNAAPGVAGGVIFPLDQTVNPIEATWQIPAEHVTNLKEGNLYVNVHSTAHPGGEIRGQIGNFETTVEFPLQPGEENPATASDASGLCVVRLNEGHSMLEANCFHTVSDPTAAHIHQGPAGTNAGVLLGFGSPSSPIVQEFELTTPEQVQAFFEGNLYVNVHSPTFPGGEIRGQVLPTLDVTRTTLAQLGEGEGLNFNLLLTNTSSNLVNGTAIFRDDPGIPLGLGITEIDGTEVDGPLSHVDFSLPPFGLSVITLDGSGDVRPASATILSDGNVAATISFEIEGLGIAGVGESQLHRAVIMPVVRDVEEGLNTGIAFKLVPFPGQEANLVDVTFTLRAADGDSEMASADTRRLLQVENGTATREGLSTEAHEALFLDELFPDADTEDFIGTLTAEASGSLIAALALILGDEPGEFTTLPVEGLDPAATSEEGQASSGGASGGSGGGGGDSGGGGNDGY